ncbi:hypothetical protein BDN67DRAFT_1014498 [Paxillus ammoniavirescens]|nr:hypothetical protein BDN67DRAFT_1014498 [Paxillus ammoniavirescens]
MLILTESTLYFLNITSNRSATKAALPGLVKNWASAVVPSTCTSTRPEPSHTTSSHVPLSVSSKGLSMKTCTTSKSSLTLPQTPANSVTDLSRPPIDGLGEGDSEDDIYEGPVGIGAKADVQGKSMRKNLLLIADEDDELTPPLSQSMEESQHTTWRRLKRKTSNTISLSSTEELKPDDGPFTGIDSDVKVVDEVFEMSVKLSENNTPSVKKMKMDTKVKMEPVESLAPSPGPGRPPKAEGAIKSRSAYRKEDLPGFILSDPQEAQLLQFAQSTFNTLYPENPDFVITSMGPIVAKILQRLCEW